MHKKKFILFMKDGKTLKVNILTQKARLWIKPIGHFLLESCYIDIHNKNKYCPKLQN